MTSANLEFQNLSDPVERSGQPSFDYLTGQMTMPRDIFGTIPPDENLDTEFDLAFDIQSPMFQMENVSPESQDIVSLTPSYVNSSKNLKKRRSAEKMTPIGSQKQDPMSSADTNSEKSNTSNVPLQSPPNSANSSNGFQVRQKYHRSRTGCLTCRQRRVKCDEKKPECDRCSKFNRKCKWPSNISTGPQSANSTQKASTKAKEWKSKGAQETKGTPNAIQPPHYANEMMGYTRPVPQELFVGNTPDFSLDSNEGFFAEQMFDPSAMTSYPFGMPYQNCMNYNCGESMNDSYFTDYVVPTIAYPNSMITPASANYETSPSNLPSIYSNSNTLSEPFGSSANYINKSPTIMLRSNSTSSENVQLNPSLSKDNSFAPYSDPEEKGSKIVVPGSPQDPTSYPAIMGKFLSSNKHSHHLSAETNMQGMNFPQALANGEAGLFDASINPKSFSIDEDRNSPLVKKYVNWYRENTTCFTYGILADPDKFFTSYLYSLAENSRSPALLFAIAACSALMLGRIFPHMKLHHKRSIQWYAKAVKYLNLEISESSLNGTVGDDMLCTSLQLVMFEKWSGNLGNWGRHIQGIFELIKCSRTPEEACQTVERRQIMVWFRCFKVLSCLLGCASMNLDDSYDQVDMQMRRKFLDYERLKLQDMRESDVSAAPSIIEKEEAYLFLIEIQIAEIELMRLLSQLTEIHVTYKNSRDDKDVKEALQNLDALIDAARSWEARNRYRFKNERFYQSNTMVDYFGNKYPSSPFGTILYEKTVINNLMIIQIAVISLCLVSKLNILSTRQFNNMRSQREELKGEIYALSIKFCQIYSGLHIMAAHLRDFSVLILPCYQLITVSWFAGKQPGEKRDWLQVRLWWRDVAGPRISFVSKKSISHMWEDPSIIYSWMPRQKLREKLIEEEAYFGFLRLNRMEERLSPSWSEPSLSTECMPNLTHNRDRSNSIQSNDASSSADSKSESVEPLAENDESIDLADSEFVKELSHLRVLDVLCPPDQDK